MGGCILPRMVVLYTYPRDINERLTGQPKATLGNPCFRLGIGKGTPFEVPSVYVVSLFILSILLIEPVNQFQICFKSS
ncbi:hypothetical protein SBF1_6140003 [Candidatus Desulfosporosinus infrequens]|uniref:Uncharacterized protein n=1 Tax=Candidatus Desulfosporosinus infrequens TaxID=2043169 RepID=A0A2U3LLY5_9FIRM|nr:hypothetical protein SBF1_6140003 [Candidatus Desulfosporosinus infrequens]